MREREREREREGEREKERERERDKEPKAFRKTYSNTEILLTSKLLTYVP